MSVGPPRIVVISLETAVERRAKIRERLGREGMEFEFFPAVDGRRKAASEHPHYDSARRRKVFGKDLTGGEIGCFLSHKAVYETMVEERIAELLILEDDVIPPPSFLEVLGSLRNCPVPFDAIRFFGDPRTSRRRQRRIYPLTNQHWMTRMATAPSGAQAYLMRLSGAEKILPHMEQIWLPVDTLLGRSWEHGLEWFTVSPPAMDYDRQLPSAIGDERFEKAKPESWAAKAGYKLSAGMHKRWRYWSAYPHDRIVRSRIENTLAISA